MFEPKEGKCFYCNGEAKFPCNWKNDWFICDTCLELIMPLLRRKKPFALVFKSSNKQEYTTLWQPFKVMDMSVMGRSLDFFWENKEMEKDFHPGRILCGGTFELDETKHLFRVLKHDKNYSPVLPISEVKDMYVQDVFHIGGAKGAYLYYDYSELCLELDNEIVPFVDFPFEYTKPVLGMLRNKKTIRKEAEAELSEIVHCKTSPTRKLIFPRIWNLIEYNPYTYAQEMKS